MPVKSVKTQFASSYLEVLPLSLIKKFKLIDVIFFKKLNQICNRKELYGQT